MNRPAVPIPYGTSAPGIQERAAGPTELSTEAYTWKSQAVFSDPAQGYPGKNEDDHRQDQRYRSGKGFALDEERHDSGVIPAGKDAIQYPSQRNAQEVNASNPNVNGPFKG